MNIVALIPARGGSKRIPKKNIKLLGGKPLIQWTIEAAKESGIFQEIYVASDDHEILDAGSDAGALPFLRVPSSDSEADIQWVSFVLKEFAFQPEAFAILRPTAPFRSAQTIRAAWQSFIVHQPADSLRAVRFASEPPQKMWVLTLGSRMVPLLPFNQPRQSSTSPIVPWHSSPTQTLPYFVVQTAGLEIAWTNTVTIQKSISGTAVLSYFMPHEEDLDINTPEDWERAERHVADLQAAAAAK